MSSASPADRLPAPARMSRLSLPVQLVERRGPAGKRPTHLYSGQQVSGPRSVMVTLTREVRTRRTKGRFDRRHVACPHRAPSLCRRARVVPSSRRKTTVVLSESERPIMDGLGPQDVRQKSRVGGAAPFCDPVLNEACSWSCIGYLSNTCSLTIISSPSVCCSKSDSDFAVVRARTAARGCRCQRLC